MLVSGLKMIICDLQAPGQWRQMQTHISQRLFKQKQASSEFTRKLLSVAKECWPLKAVLVMPNGQQCWSLCFFASWKTSRKSSLAATGPWILVATSLPFCRWWAWLLQTELAEGGAARLQPRLPHHVPQWQLTFHGLHGPLVRLHRLLHRPEDGVKGRLRVGGERPRFRGVPRQVEEQRRIVVGHVRRCAEADVRVETGRPVLRVEVWREVKGFPHRATWGGVNRTGGDHKRNRRKTSGFPV